jgi:hypothetical protein
MDVIWQKCGKDNHWCSLENLDLDSVGEVSGVYMIWHEGTAGKPSRVVRTGQGSPIKSRLSAHRNDKEILAYKKFGTLRVTWAAVSILYRDQVERYLAEAWPPLVGSAFPDVQPLAVNSPW